jgi:hypothetical protein
MSHCSKLSFRLGENQIIVVPQGSVGEVDKAVLDERDFQVVDIRGAEEDFSVHIHGFQVMKTPTKVGSCFFCFVRKLTSDEKKRLRTSWTSKKWSSFTCARSRSW